MHKWVLLLKFLSKKKIHTWLLLLCSRERRSAVSDCSFPKAFPFIWLSNSPFPTHRILPRKPGMMVSHSIFYLSHAKAEKNHLYSALGAAFLLHSGNSFRSTFYFCPCFFLEDHNPWKCLFKLQELDWALCNSSIQDYIQSTVHCLSLVHPHLPVLTRHK